MYQVDIATTPKIKIRKTSPVIVYILFKLTICITPSLQLYLIYARKGLKFHKNQIFSQKNRIDEWYTGNIAKIKRQRPCLCLRFNLRFVRFECCCSLDEIPTGVLSDCSNHLCFKILVELLNNQTETMSLSMFNSLDEGLYNHCTPAL